MGAAQIVFSYYVGTQSMVNWDTFQCADLFTCSFRKPARMPLHNLSDISILVSL